MVKNPPANAGGAGDAGLIPIREDSLEEGIVAWKISWTKDPGWL